MQILAVPVWDRFVRLFHWSLVLCISLDEFVAEEGETLHQALGYIACALVVARIVWGFVGSPHARFTDFVPTPARLMAHLHNLRHGVPEEHLGHNPLGGLMVLALMVMVLAIGVTGHLQGTDAFWGEEWLQDLHETLAEGLLVLVGLHVAGALVMSRLESTNLIAAMITGIKVRRRD